MATAMAQLRERLAEIADLHHASKLMHWDEDVMMPAGGAPQRAEASATLARIEHEMFVHADTARLLEAAAREVEGLGEDADDLRIVRKTQRNYDKAKRVPASLEAEMAKAASEGYHAWVAAREADDFKAFAPYLRHNLELVGRYVECFDSYDSPYDVLLDDYDPGTTSAEVTQLFTELRDQLVPLISQLRGLETDVSPLDVAYPVEGQRRLVEEVMRRMGWNEQAWRLDDTVHPFAMYLGSNDVRITTRYEPAHFPTALYGAMHECGHGLYDAGIAPELQRTPLGATDSLAIHESQSRMWENFVGRGREFSELVTPRLVELSGGSLNGLSADALFKAVNAVIPSPVRIEADETTYSLHVILRFEIEQDLINGRIAVDELPDAWNSRMVEFLGITPPNDADGVLQDVHWSQGLIGYFSTYALGNLIAGQLWQQLKRDIPDLSDQLKAGEFQGLRGWLLEHVHRHGSKYSSRELLERVVGAPIAVSPFVNHLKAKLSDVYGLTLA